MTGLVGRLHEQGLVERTPDQHDRRSVRVSATASGRELLARRRHERAEALAVLIAALGTDDQAALAAAVPAICRLVSGGTRPRPPQHPTPAPRARSASRRPSGPSRSPA
jgi:DNA-binding MarR family transcriptional regulator